MHHESTARAKWTDHPMFDLGPEIVEVQAAKAVFLKRVRHFAPYAHRFPRDPGYMSPETVVACALADVWKQGRKYQRDKNRAELFELAGIKESR